MVKKNFLIIIPARAGSKSIKNKNILKFNKKPLISWTINQALKIKSARVVVSTDSKKIKKIAEEYGAEVPYLRKSNLSNDTIGIEPVLIDMVNHLKHSENYQPDAVILLMPTSPFRKINDIFRAIKLFKKNLYTSIVSVSKAIANQNPHWMLKEYKGNTLLSTGENLNKIKPRRQDLPEIFIRNDFVYIIKTQNLYNKTPGLYGKKVKLLKINEDRYDVDINSKKDWKIAEYIFKLEN